MKYFDDPEYRNTRSGEDQPQTEPGEKSFWSKVNKHIKNHNPRTIPDEHFYIVIGYFAAFVGTVAGAAFLVDQKENGGKYSPIFLPQEAKELERSDPHTRSFAVQASKKDQIICGELNIGYKSTTYDRFMTVHRSEEKVGSAAILNIKDTQNAHNNTLDTIVSCTYPESDPSYIRKIPIER